MFNINTGLLYYLFNEQNKILPADYYPVAYAIGIVLIMVIGYLLGSVNAAIIVSKGFYGDDIRNHGSGNAGMTNMLRTFGLGAAGLTLLGDVLKTVISISVAGLLFGFNYVGGVSTGDGVCYIAGLFVVIGHIFPIFYKMKGGKGVLATAAMALILAPIPFLILLAIFVIVVAIWKYVSLGSVIGVILFPVVMHGYFHVLFKIGMPGFAALTTIILAILVVWCHRENLKRVSEGTERKLSFGKKKTESAADTAADLSDDADEEAIKGEAEDGNEE